MAKSKGKGPRVVVRTHDDNGDALCFSPEAARAIADLTATGYYGVDCQETVEQLLLRAIRDEIASGILERG